MSGLRGRARLALLVAAVLGGCGGNVTVSRGFGSREVLPLRDPTISLTYVSDVAGQDPSLVYTTQGAGLTYWSLDLVTGTLQNLGGQPPSGTPGSPPPPTGRYSCQVVGLTSDGTSTLQIVDGTTGLETDVDGVVTYAGCPGDDGTLSIFRLDPDSGDGLLLWSGPYQQLAMVPLPITVRSIVRFRSTAAATPDAGAPAVPDIVVSGSVPGEPDAVGIYTIDLPSVTVTNAVPATLAGAAWATGAPQAGSLGSGSVSRGLAISRFNGHYIYGRTMDDGGTTMFAGPFDTGPARELALFQVSASAPGGMLGQGLRVAPPDDATAPVTVPAMASWELEGPGGSPNQLMVWDDTDAQMAVCPSSSGAFQAGTLSPDGKHVLFSQASGGTLASVGPLQLLTLGAGGTGSCIELGDGNVFWADTSGDGSMIAWIAETDPTTLDGQLWIANGDGTGAQMVFAGTLYGARFVSGTTKLELSYGGDLVWLDIHDPTHLVYVAEDLFGATTGVGGWWFVGGYDYSTQDSSGLLGAINLDTGKKMQISPSVSQYLVAAQTVASSGDTLSSATQLTGLSHVVYLVRGRNPSPQDGIWMATIDAADLQ